MGVMRWLVGSQPERSRSVLDGAGEIMGLNADEVQAASGNALTAMLYSADAGTRAVVQVEVQVRQIRALEESAYQQSVSSARLERLTLWLVALTIAIVALTVVLLIVGG
jgi:hypothetical protein